MLIKPYSSTDEFAKTMWEDPARIVGDVLTVVSAGAGGVTKFSQVNKAKLISEVRLATTLEQKSALIQRAVNMVQLEKGATKVMEISNKINPYISAPKYAIRGTQLLAGGAGNIL
jgi:methionyl-tRNA synthetase